MDIPASRAMADVVCRSFTVSLPRDLSGERVARVPVVFPLKAEIPVIGGLAYSGI
jgi:hypothetical protein